MAKEKESTQVKMDYTTDGYKTNVDGTINFKIKLFPVWWTVKPEFMEKVPDPKNVDHIVLIEEHAIQNFWHCTVGPAVTADNAEIRNHFKGDIYKEYWIDGKRLSDEQARAEEHRLKFDNKFEDLVNAQSK